MHTSDLCYDFFSSKYVLTNLEIHVCFCIHCINCLFILTNLPEIFCIWCKKCLNIIIWVEYYTLRSHKNHYIKYLKPTHILGNADNATHPLSVLLLLIVGLIRIISPLSRRKINLNEADLVKIYSFDSWPGMSPVVYFRYKLHL